MPTNPPPSTDPTTTTTTTTTSTTTHHKPHDTSTTLPHKPHSALAAAHGTGEALRGHFNAAVDSAFGETKGVQKNARVENEGLNEIASGRFGEGTKVREGAVLGDGGKGRGEGELNDI